MDRFQKTFLISIMIAGMIAGGLLSIALILSQVHVSGSSDEGVNVASVPKSSDSGAKKDDNISIGDLDLGSSSGANNHRDEFSAMKSPVPSIKKRNIPSQQGFDLTAMKVGWNGTFNTQRFDLGQTTALPLTPIDRASEKRTNPSAKRATAVFHVQLISVTVKIRALKEAVRLSRVHRSLLGPVPIKVAPSKLARQGVVYRLQAGPFRDRVSADQLCRELSRARQDCYVTRH